MNQIIKSVGKYSIKLRTNPFLALVESIVNQQLTGKAARSIYDRFLNHYVSYNYSPLIVHSMSDNLMKTFGLSTKKIEYIKNLSHSIFEGNVIINQEFFLDKSDIETVNYLTKISGIGIWTAHMFMIFCLGRQDVFPFTDLGLKKSIGKWYFSNSKDYPTESQMLSISSKWKPFRSIATWYLWKSALNFDTIG